MSARIIRCTMLNDCAQPITHIDNKGFVYCELHGKQRRIHHRIPCRRLKKWEVEFIFGGKPIPSYAPCRKPVGAA